MTDGVKLGDFQKLCEELYKQKVVVDEIEAHQKQENKKFEALKAKVLAHLEENELEKYAVSGYGTVFIREYTSVKVPKSPQERDQFFGYLKDKGIFEQTITVHSQTLNSLYKNALEEAIEKGDHTFKIPGIGEPSVSKKLTVRSS